MEDPREADQQVVVPPKKRPRKEIEEQIQQDQEHLKKVYQDKSHYSIFIDNETVDKAEKENRLESTALGFATEDPSGKYMLTGKVDSLKKITVREFFAVKQKEFVDFLTKILPKDGKKWLDMITGVTADEWMATVANKVLPEIDKPGGLDSLLTHILTFSNVSPQDLGPDEAACKQNFDSIKRYLLAFAKLVRKIKSFPETVPVPTSNNSTSGQKT